MIRLIKRDCSISDFNKDKITIAIEKAMKNGSGIYEPQIAKNISDDIENELKEVAEVSIYKIEEMVFDKLVEYNQKETARAYESYRTVREMQRRENTTDDSIEGLIKRTNKSVLKENSNKSANVACTQRDLIAGEVSKDIAKRRLIPAHLVQAHEDRIIHIHDMDYMIQPIFNCCLINLQDMLDNGTVINEKKVNSPSCFATACTITTQIMAQVASNQYGGQSITIAHLAPYLRKTYYKYLNLFKDQDNKEEIAERLTHKELRDGVQTIRYQLSTLQTSNGQLGCL